MTIETIAMPDGVKLAVHTIGSGPAVLLLHGFISNAALNWINPGTAAALAAVGLRVIMPEFRGHGGSDAPTEAPTEAGSYPPDVLASDMEAVIAGFNLTDFDLGGYSLGARTAMRLVARGVRPRRLMLGGMGLGGMLGMGARRDWFIKAIEQRGDWPKGSAESFVGLFLKSTGTNPEAAIHVMQSQVDNTMADIQSVSCPTLVVCGKNDHDNGSAQELAAAIPGAQYVEVSGNHMSAVGSQGLQEAMLGFLQ